MGLRHIRTALALLLATASCFAATGRDAVVPAALEPWIPWVLRDLGDSACPRRDGEPVCVASSSLDLRVVGSQAGFRLEGWRWSDGWVRLPGDSSLWPESVRSGGAPVPVLAPGGRPSVFLKSGPFRLEGILRWTRRPSSIQLPEDVAFHRLEVDGRPTESVDGRALWLSRSDDTAAGEASDTAGDVRIKVFRRVDDGVPSRATTRLELSVSGKERPLELADVLPAGSIPTGIESDLPARLTRQGKLGLTARSGNWTVVVRSAWIVPPDTFRVSRSGAPWPASEIWSFRSAPDIRTVQLSGATPVDAAQAEVPQSDRDLPAWSLSRDRALAVAQVLRGDPATDSVKVRLERRVWIDFDGGGATVRDDLVGEANRPLRLSVAAPLRLGRGEIRGEGQVLTTLGGAEQGFPVQGRGPWSLLSRLEDGIWTDLPISPVGWDLEAATVQVHLGLGWRLLEIAGPGESTGTWLSGWNLWSIFLLVLVVGILAQLVSRKAAAVGAVVFVLGSQDQIGIAHWLHFLVAVSAWLALKERIPDRLPARLAAVWAGIAALIVAGIAISFTVAQVRLAMHPHLDNSNEGYAYDRMDMAEPVPALDTAAVVEESGMDRASMQNSISGGSLPSSRSAYASKQGRAWSKEILLEDDPMLLGAVQAGPGVPDWLHNAGSLRSNGAVSGAQTFRVVALPPLAVRIWRLAAVAGMWVLLFLVAAKSLPGAVGRIRFRPAAAPPKLAALVLLAAAGARAELPSPDLLRDLRAHLVAPPACGDACVHPGEARITLRGGQAVVELDVQAQARGIVRLPQVDWRATGLTIPRGAAGSDGRSTWAVVEPGFQTIRMEGVPKDGALLVGFQDIPFRRRIDAPGWTREGDAPSSVHLVRSAGSDAGGKPDTTVAELAPLAHVSRTLRLKRDWTVETVVERASEAPGALALSIPLLAGERPLGEVSADSGQARVVLASGVDRISWVSRLPASDRIRLAAPRNPLWTETWSLESSTRWHVQAAGVPRVRSETNTWMPLPGETLSVAVASPRTLDGPVMSVQSASIRCEAGRDLTQCTLRASVVSGIGGDIFATLPSDARIRSIAVDGLERPRQPARDGRQRIELSPGTRWIDIQWSAPSAGRFLVRSPEVVLSAGGANFRASLESMDDTWVVALGGPGEGPGILWWGMVAAMAIVSWILSRVPGQPLRFVDWFLLFLGTSTVFRFGGLPFVAWVGVMLWRGRFDPTSVKPWQFRALQTGIAGLAAVAFLVLLAMVPVGLLGRPEMLVEGPFGDRTWFVDRSGGELPRPWLFALPRWLWKALLLAWSLWMVRALLSWAKWGWSAFARNGAWRSDAKSEPPPSPIQP